MRRLALVLLALPGCHGLAEDQPCVPATPPDVDDTSEDASLADEPPPVTLGATLGRPTSLVFERVGPCVLTSARTATPPAPASIAASPMSRSIDS